MAPEYGTLYQILSQLADELDQAGAFTLGNEISSNSVVSNSHCIVSSLLLLLQVKFHRFNTLLPLERKEMKLRLRFYLLMDWKIALNLKYSLL